MFEEDFLLAKLPKKTRSKKVFDKSNDCARSHTEQGKVWKYFSLNSDWRCECIREQLPDLENDNYITSKLATHYFYFKETNGFHEILYGYTHVSSTKHNKYYVVGGPKAGQKLTTKQVRDLGLSDVYREYNNAGYAAENHLSMIFIYKPLLGISIPFNEYVMEDDT